jgi:hypothetical protein
VVGSLSELVRAAAGAFGDAPALQIRRGGRVDRVSFREAGSHAARVAGWLRASGLAPGDRVPFDEPPGGGCQGGVRSARGVRSRDVKTDWPQLAVLALDYDGTIAVDGALDPAALRALGAGLGLGAEVDWTLLQDLPATDAVLLPPTAEAGDGPRRFRVAARVTAHVRHREKYADAIVSDGRAFVFTADGRPTGSRARTLRELADGVASAAPESLDGHLCRGDIPRWVEDVFGDEALAAALRALQRGYDRGRVEATRDAVVAAVRGRYAAAADRP